VVVAPVLIVATLIVTVCSIAALVWAADKCVGTGVIMSTEHYREYMLECVQLAEVTDSPEVKATLVDMARCWVKLTDLVEENALVENIYAPPRRIRRDAA
jgi:hypothetical protein